MSRIGKHPVILPQSVTVSQSGLSVTVAGKLGALTAPISEFVSLVIDSAQVVVSPVSQTKVSISHWGTFRKLIANMVKGVNEGFSYTLNLVGVGYRASVAGQKLTLQLGYSHDINYDLPVSVKAKVEKPTEIVLSGPCKQQLGQIAAELRGYRKPEPYKGKGVVRQNEYVVRKEGKKK